MIKPYFTRLLVLICLATSVLFIASCEKDEDAVGSGQVELISFGPTGSNHGDTLRFFGNNLNQVTSIELTGATVEKANFISQTASLILIIVPQSTVTGYVTLKTPAGDVSSKTQLNLGVTTVVTSMTLQARPGENVTINGNYLNWVTSVTFAEDKVVTTFVSQTMTQLVVTIPADAQTGPLVLNYSGTTASNLQTADTLKVSLPVTTSISPNPAKHADNITITGTNLDLVTKILFTGVTAPETTFVSQSATQIVVKVPGTAKQGKLTLVPLSGVLSVSAMDLGIVLPAATTLAPNPVDPGTNLTIKGTNLNLVTSITFENAPAVTSFGSQSDTEIVVTVPMGVARGNLTLGVLNSTLTVQSATVLEILGAAPPPAIAFPFYDDALVSSNWLGGLGGGYGGTKDIDNTSPVRAGTKSIRINYEGGYGSPLQFGWGGATATNFAPYTTFKISIYGGAGSAGKRVSLAFDGTDVKTIELVPDAWTDYSFTISSLTSAASVKEILVKEYSGTGGFTIYVDAIGLN